MNKTLVFHYVSKTLLLGSSLFLVPCLVSIVYGEKDTALVFLITAICVAIVSTPLAIIRPKNKTMYAREGLVIVAFLWLIFPLAASIPFYISGEIPHFADAVFESFSGFTTTGATVVSDVEEMSKGMLFFRSLTHWVGGMGVLVLAVAILPSSSNSMYLMQAECAGPQVGKIVPRGKNSALYLYIIYGALTFVTFILLCIGDMPVFDSVCHAMGIAGTGGFSVKNAGIAFYDSPYIESVVTVMMGLFGVNFSLYYFLLIRRFKDVFKNTEFKVYVITMAVAAAVMAANIYPIYRSVGISIRHGIFQAVSIMTSTGFYTADYTLWPTLSQMIIFILMCIGACAGSTGGGFKVQRFIIMFKSLVKTVKKTLHPKSVNIVKSNDKTMDSSVVHGVHNYLVLYLGLSAISLLIVALDNMDFATTFTSIAACINNMGPGFGAVGPAANYSGFSDLSKIVLSVDMLLGRLECFPIIIMLSPSVWRKNF